MAEPPDSSPRRAVAMFSGGLDSVLAARLIMDQGIEVLGLHFTGWFCAGSGGERKILLARRVAAHIGLPLRVIALGMDFHRMLEAPPHGRGREANPCIDCKIFMLRRARQIMDEIGASFAITGEVLGQRPMSQRLQAMQIIERESGLADLLLRPLSAQHLPPTLPEREGWVDRDSLLGIKGRSRKEQYALAASLGIDQHGAPAGGCLLTDPSISARLLDLFARFQDYNRIDARLCAVGRHFRLGEKSKAILGRNEQENDKLLHLAARHVVVDFDEDLPGPLALVRGPLGEREQEQLSRILFHFARKIDRPEAPLLLHSPEGTVRFLATQRAGADEVAAARIG